MNFPLGYDLNTLCKSAKENLKRTSFEIVQLTDFMVFECFHFLSCLNSELTSSLKMAGILFILWTVSVDVSVTQFVRVWIELAMYMQCKMLLWTCWYLQSTGKIHEVAYSIRNVCIYAAKYLQFYPFRSLHVISFSFRVFVIIFRYKSGQGYDPFCFVVLHIKVKPA
jgi:hypothetical protein